MSGGILVILLPFGPPGAGGVREGRPEARLPPAGRTAEPAAGTVR